MRATSQVAEPSPSYCTASESGVRSRRCVDRCFATESRIPTAKHCGMFRHEPRGACVRRSGGLARRFRHQTGCGCNQAQTIGGEAVTGAPGFRHQAGACVSHAQGRQRNAGGADRADPIFPAQKRHTIRTNRCPRDTVTQPMIESGERAVNRSCAVRLVIGHGLQRRYTGAL